MDITKTRSKKKMIEFFGGAKATYTAYGCSHPALCQMPDKLDDKRRDRFVGAAVRLGIVRIK